MKKFNRNLLYKDVIFLNPDKLENAKSSPFSRTLEQGKDFSMQIVIVSNVVLYPFLNQYMHYYDNTIDIAYQMLHDFFASKNPTDSVFFLLDLKQILSDVYYHIYEMGSEEREEKISLFKQYLEKIIRKAQEISNQVFFWKFEIDPTDTVPEGQIGFNEIIENLNQYLEKLSLEYKNLFLIDSNQMISIIGIEQSYDKKKYYLLNSPYSMLIYNYMAYTLIRAIHNRSHPPKKCLILDCDNVLWRGAIRDLGVSGIQVSNQYLGRAYLEFQREVLKLYNQGVVIGLCSKNEYQDVLEILNHHPDMLLREKHIACFKISDNNKADSIRELSREWNISLDSIVFMDDSPYEIALIQRELPEVTAILLDADKPYSFTEILRKSDLFTKKKITEMDRVRVRNYKEAEERKRCYSKITDMEGYQKYLDTKMILNEMDDYSFSRVVELSQRTNQFNLSDLRLDMSSLKKWIDDPNHIALTLQIKDVFGDMGIVAAALIEYGAEKATITGFFLSCRAFERGCEEELLRCIREKTEKRGIKKIYGIFKENGKNFRYADFYKEHSIVCVKM